MISFPRNVIGTPLRLAALLFAVLLVGAGCAASTDTFGNEVVGGDPTAEESPIPQASAVGDSSANTDSQADSDDAVVAVGSSPDTSTIADLITELPPAPTGLPLAEEPVRRPIGLSIDSLGIDVATVIDVGVEDNGDMEIPPADEVGWYGFGPTPGDVGSSVLAAHIAFDGQDGVFVDLDKLELGSIITVSYDDGSTADFEAVSKEQYEKEQLPRDAIFARDGDPRLVLITCGGDFNRQVRSYEDNVVIYANPVG